jgi:hypothetical protein
MSHIPYFNFPAFFAAQTALEAKGYETFNPAKKDIDLFGDVFDECTEGSHEQFYKLLSDRGIDHHPDMRHFARIDLNWMIDNADAIYLLEGWEKSKGARAEKALADWIGLEFVTL